MAENPSAPPSRTDYAAYASQKTPGGASRPLSPFMIGPYYKPQITSMLSITHRLTGLGLAVGTLLIALWVMSAAAGPAAYADFSGFARSILGRVLLFAWSWALIYHLCNGIRHLVWDTGHAFEMKSVYLGGYIVIGASVVLTIAVWLFAFL
jgi:succinate dehydrogenase / fumarate reductase cytochrome b subunit